VLTIALVDGVGIQIALGDPEVSADRAAGEVLSALSALLGPGAEPPGPPEQAP
jgi:hypothetical protein